MVPAVLLAPIVNDSAPVSVQFTEEAGAIDATVTLKPGAGTQTVVVAAYANATANPTTMGGPYNEYLQLRTDAKIVVLTPSCPTATLEVCKDPDGCCEGQETGTQCDVNSMCGDQTCGGLNDPWVVEHEAPLNLSCIFTSDRSDVTFASGGIWSEDPSCNAQPGVVIPIANAQPSAIIPIANAQPVVAIPITPVLEPGQQPVEAE